MSVEATSFTQPEVGHRKVGPFLNREEFVDPNCVRDVVSSKHVFDGRWKTLTADTSIPGVTKQIVPIKHDGSRLSVITTVAPGTKVARHAHDAGSVIRYIMSGSMTCNDVVYRPGDWMIVPAGAEYEIYTERGYMALVEYSSCDACR